jgi:hypothetical protein
MSLLYNIYVVNTDINCNNDVIVQQVDITGCNQNVLVQMSLGSTAIGPFDIYTGNTGTTAIYTGVTRTNLIDGVVLTLINPVACVTPTPSVTPSITPTISLTPTLTPSHTATPTVTPTITPTSSPNPYNAYLFIEPVTGATDIGQYLYDLNNSRTFFGFSNSSIPDTTNSSQFNIDMNEYVSFSGWTTGKFPTIGVSTVPLSSGGVDDFGNAVEMFNFKTFEVPVNTVGSSAWYTWIIPISATNGMIQTKIDYNADGNPNSFTTVITDTTINEETFIYTGTTIPLNTYRVYTTFADLAFFINDTDNIYFKGNTVS